MSDTTAASNPKDGRSFGYVSIAAVLLGLLVAAFGGLLLSTSPLGGLWIVAIGIATALAGLFSTPWAGRRLGISDADRRTLTLSCVAVATVLAVAFAVINGFGSVESGEVTN